MPGMSSQNPDEFENYLRNCGVGREIFGMPGNELFEKRAPQPAIDYSKRDVRPPVRQEQPMHHDTAHSNAEQLRLTRENNALLHHLHETLSSVHLPSKPAEPSRLSKLWTRLKNYASSVKSELSEFHPFLIALFWTAAPWIVIEILVLKIFGSHMVFQPNLARYLIGAAVLSAIGRGLMVHLLLLMEKHNFDATTQTWRSATSQHAYENTIMWRQAFTAGLVMTAIFGTMWFYLNLITLMN